MSGAEYPAGTGGSCLLLYVRGAGVASGEVVEAASTMKEGDDSGIGEHAAGGVPGSGDAAEDDGGGGVPAAVVCSEAATGDGVPAEAGGGEAISNDTTGGVGGADTGGAALHPTPPTVAATPT